MLLKKQNLLKLPKFALKLKLFAEKCSVDDKCELGQCYERYGWMKGCSCPQGYGGDKCDVIDDASQFDLKLLNFAHFNFALGFSRA